MTDYDGQVAVVAGGGHGIGRAIAEALAARGMRRGGRYRLARAIKVAKRIGGIAAVCDVGGRNPCDVIDTAIQIQGALGMSHDIPHLCTGLTTP